MKLNDQQEIAVSHRDGPCLCTACPGSGKTRVIVERTARMLENGIGPRSVLCITFTNKAAAEMKERVLQRVGDSGKFIFIATFHRLASSILRHHGHHLGYDGNLTILDEDDQISLMLQCARQKEFELTKPEVKKIVWNVNDWREKLETNDELYDRFEDIKQGRWAEIAFEYLTRANKSNMIDFSGLLSETVKLLTQFPVVLEAAQKRWKYFMVDEVQDTNLSQFKVVELLSSHTKNVFVVGDLDQSIYSWRGARIENIKDFQTKFAGTQVISLGKNYRSTPQIIKAADTLIRHNPDRIEVPFTTDNPDGAPIIVTAYQSDIQEADSTAKVIKKMVESGQVSYKEVAVFYRINAMSRAIEMAMISNSIPHTVIGNFSFFDRREIKDCMAMLRFLSNPKDGIAFHRFCNSPKRSLGDTTVGKVELYSKEHDCSILEAIQTMRFPSQNANDGIKEIELAYNFDHQNKTVAECLTHLVEKLRYKEHIDDDVDTAADRWENVQELIRDAARYSAAKGVAQYLDQIALMSNSDKSADGNAVSLMSLHASKGLEFPVVFMIGVEQNVLPHKKAVDERVDGIEEERRLCYVGMTRAKKSLSMSYCRQRQDGFAATKGKVNHKKVSPSQFLHEAGVLEKPKPQLVPAGQTIYDHM